LGFLIFFPALTLAEVFGLGRSNSDLMVQENEPQLGFERRRLSRNRALTCKAKIATETELKERYS
jgi:hypothetical protein